METIKEFIVVGKSIHKEKEENRVVEIWLKRDWERKCTLIVK